MPSFSPVKPGMRPAAPHVQAALARSAQPRMPAMPVPPVMSVMPAMPAIPPIPATRRDPRHPPPPIAFRPAVPAPHVAVQAKGVAPARPVAPHVQAALSRGVQAKLAPAAPSTARVPRQFPAASPASAPRPAPRPAPAALPRVVQRSVLVKETEVEEELPEVIRGMNRDGDTVRTAGGTWRATRYVALTRLGHAPCHGAFMNLAFTPEHPANATKIALVQSVTTAKNNAMYYQGNATTKARSVVGTSIDQVGAGRSPLYADEAATGDGDLGSSSVQQGAGDHGYRYQTSAGWQVKAATLRDTPHLRGVEDFSFQVFETTALAIAGEDAGTYYGSVKWGWWLKSDGGVLLVPLRVLSDGSVTAEFKASLTRWNETRTSGGEIPQQLPAPP